MGFPRFRGKAGPAEAQKPVLTTQLAFDSRHIVVSTVTFSGSFLFLQTPGSDHLLAASA